jgi:hypothetical protein
MGTSKCVCTLKDAAALYFMYFIRKGRLLDCYVNMSCLNVGTVLKVICSRVL